MNLDTTEEVEKYAEIETSTVRGNAPDVVEEQTEVDIPAPVPAIPELPEGMKKLVRGYIDYSAETIQQRALPGIDGFKPVHRHILFTMFKDKITSLTKCADVVGSTMKLHPHGDSSIYDALTKITESSEYMNMPFIVGKGNLGKVYDECSPAAYRYTECMMHSITVEIFKDLDGAKWGKNYDDKIDEPVLLPVPFPNVLCNGTTGIAVGVATVMPMFNFNEANNAVIEYIEHGKVINYLKPDYPTGGTYVMSQKDIVALNETGRATIKLRGTWFIEGNKIVIKEIPYYTTVDAILREAKKIQGVASANDSSDIKGMEIEITCTSKRNVEFVLAELLKKTNLQMTKTTNMNIIVDNHPKVMGVQDIIKCWVEFRTDILNKKLTKELENLNRSIEDYEYLVRLFENKDWTDRFCDENRISGSRASIYLKELFPDIKDSTVEYIVGQSFRAISNIAKRKATLNGMYANRDKVKYDLEHISELIVKQLKELNRKYPTPRKTEVSDFDYKLNENTSKVKAHAIPVIAQFNGRFIKKLRVTPATMNEEGIRCNSDDVIACVDNRGRIIRVYLDTLDFNTMGDRGTYIPVYIDGEDDFEIIITEVIGDKKGCYMYDDGYVTVVDYSEWKDIRKRTKVTERGIAPMTDKLIGEIDLSKPYVFVLTKFGRAGILSTEFKHKHRMARTKLIGVPQNDKITHCFSCDTMQLLQVISNSGNYMNKLVKIKDEVNYDLLNEMLNTQE